MSPFQSKFTSAQLQATRSLLRCMKYECCNRFDKQNYQQIWARKKRATEEEEIVYVNKANPDGAKTTQRAEAFLGQMERDYPAKAAEEEAVEREPEASVRGFE